MVETLRSMTGFSWAMTLFGARQLGNLVLADADRAAAAFDTVAAAARSGFGDNMNRTLGAGDHLQSAAVDRLFGVVGGDPVAFSLAMLEPSAQALKVLPGQRHTGQELANKVRAFRDFQYVESWLGLADDTPLAARIEKATTLGAYHGLWAVEGLGFAHAEQAWRASEPPKALLHGAAWPREVTLPLHTGLGASLAMRCLGGVDTRGDDEELRGALERFITLCEVNAVPGCQPMAFEALGLVVRQLHPHLLERVDRLLVAIGPELSACFWHGVGRALYFLPSHVPPTRGAWNRALSKARVEPPREAGRANALVGFVWALTLVNIRHPEILEDFLYCHADGSLDHWAVAHGVSSALLVWHGSNGREAILECFLDHRPSPAVARVWQRLVKMPAEAALHSSLGSPAALADLFHYQQSGGKDQGAAAGHYDATLPALPALARGLDGWVGRALQSLSRDTQDGPRRGEMA